MKKLTEADKKKMNELEAEYLKLENDLLENEEGYSQKKIDTILAKMNSLQDGVARIAHKK